MVRQNLIYFAKYIYYFGGAIIILIGILTIIRDSKGNNRICSRISGWFNRRMLGIQPVTLGLIVGLLPCAPLLAVLSYIGLVSLVWQRCILYSLVFGLGTLISPLLILALGAGAVPKMLLNKPKAYRALRLVSGFIIVFFGTQLILRTING